MFLHDLICWFYPLTISMRLFTNLFFWTFFRSSDESIKLFLDSICLVYKTTGPVWTCFPTFLLALAFWCWDWSIASLLSSICLVLRLISAPVMNLFSKFFANTYILKSSWIDEAIIWINLLVLKSNTAVWAFYNFWQHLFFEVYFGSV